MPYIQLDGIISINLVRNLIIGTSSEGFFLPKNNQLSLYSYL